MWSVTAQIFIILWLVWSSWLSKEVGAAYCKTKLLATTSPQNIQSPNHPDLYPDNSDCAWNITAPPGYVIRLEFKSLDIEFGGDNCPFDYVEILDTKYCGKLLPKPVMSSSNSLRVVFHTDFSEKGSGFKVTYTAVETDECLSSPCENGGTCQDKLDGFLCLCPPGFFGASCQTDIDECASSPCYHGGWCVDDLNSFLCQCIMGYTGTLCETEINECFPNPCNNNAICSDLINDFSCSCQPGFQGRKCDQDIDECQSRPCEHGGTCENLVNYFLCHCEPGFEGEMCEREIDDCHPSPCQHQGDNCTDYVNDFECQCIPGYTGKTCEIDIDECADHPCQNNATCTDLTDDFTCSCLPGFNGKSCENEINECASHPCQHGGKCMDIVNGFFCACAIGYDGDTCEIDIDDCASTPCANGGTCSDLVGEFQCACPTGLEGKDCSQNTDDCADSPCQNGGNCTDLVADYLCSCPSGFRNKSCETDVEACEPTFCLNGGTCEDLANGLHCLCSDGYTGEICEIEVQRLEDQGLRWSQGTPTGRLTNGMLVILGVLGIFFFIVGIALIISYRCKKSRHGAHSARGRCEDNDLIEVIEWPLTKKLLPSEHRESTKAPKPISSWTFCEADQEISSPRIQPDDKIVNPLTAEAPLVHTDIEDDVHSSALSDGSKDVSFQEELKTEAAPNAAIESKEGTITFNADGLQKGETTSATDGLQEGETCIEAKREPEQENAASLEFSDLVSFHNRLEETIENLVRSEEEKTETLGRTEEGVMENAVCADDGNNLSRNSLPEPPNFLLEGPASSASPLEYALLSSEL